MDGPDEERRNEAPRAESRRAERRGDVTKRALFGAAEEIFARRGYHAASIAEIAQVAGVGLGTFYLHYPRKLDAFTQVLRTRRAQWTQATLEAAEGADDSRIATQRALATYFNWIAQRPRLVPLFREAQFIDPSLIPALYIDPAKTIARRLERTISDGAMRRADPEVLAWFMIASAEFAALYSDAWRPGRDAGERGFAAFLEIASYALGLGAPPDAD